MTKAIRIHANGPPSAMKWEEVEPGKPGKGEARIRHTAVGLNFIDTYHRSGLYKLPMPLVLGMEGAGVVEAVGRGVTGLKPGDRVAYATTPLGSYSEARLIPADRLVKVPSGISDEQAASMMLKGMTACYLLRRTYRVQKGDTVLIHAAAGGVGLIACQWAKHLGATVIGTVGGPAKAKLAKAHGCDHAIDYSKEDFVARVKKITRGKGVPVVYDSVGKTTLDGSLDCLSPRGTMVSFGNASGPPAPVSPLTLGAKGSLFLTRPSLPSYIATRKELEAIAKELFAVVKSGAVKLEINQRYALKDAAKAHRDLEARKTTGSTILIP
ncbi:MAG: NADPH:quinone reductase [Alphaproteobacteria bacterium]|nr:NADPH:quinone reductase [Alphaproteobacteria bacterium]